jgi:hypothetical protein
MCALSSWSWLFPPKFTLWLANRFCDLFLILDDGSVHMLEVGAGSLTKVADNRDEFCNKLDDDEIANNWLMIPLVRKLSAAGIRLQPGQCYAFKQPPVLGGDYTVDNCGPWPIADYLGAYGSVHEQLRDVPDGENVIIQKKGKPPE